MSWETDADMAQERQEWLESLPAELEVATRLLVEADKLLAPISPVMDPTPTQKKIAELRESINKFLEGGNDV